MFRRYYNNKDFPPKGRLGSNCRSSYDAYLDTVTVTNLPNPRAIITRPTGRRLYYFKDTTTGVVVGDPDNPERLTELTDGGGTTLGWEYHTVDDVVEHYSAAGRLETLTNRQGLTQILGYDTNGRLETVTGLRGRQLSFGYDTEGRIETMTDPNGAVYGYGYDNLNNLETVTYPDATPSNPNDNPTKTYLYEDSRPGFAHALTGILDENGNGYASYGYDSEGRANLSEHADGAGRVDLEHNDYVDGTTTTTVTETISDTQQTVRTYTFVAQHGMAKPTEVTRSQCRGCPSSETYSYDDNGFVQSHTDWNGNTTTYVHDTRGLESERVEAVGTSEQRTIQTDWESDYRLPMEIRVYVRTPTARCSSAPT